MTKCTILYDNSLQYVISFAISVHFSCTILHDNTYGKILNLYIMFALFWIKTIPFHEENKSSKKNPQKTKLMDSFIQTLKCTTTLENHSVQTIQRCNFTVPIVLCKPFRIPFTVLIVPCKLFSVPFTVPIILCKPFTVPLKAFPNSELPHSGIMSQNSA
jgi:hypothetical protein